MWAPFKAQRERRAAEQQRFLDALALIAEHFARASDSQSSAVGKLAEASAAQASALSEHLAMFRTGDAPTTRVMRDQDELVAEMARDAASAAWVLRATEDPTH